MVVFVLALALIVYLDARMLRRQNKGLFDAVFAVSPRLAAIIAGLILFHLGIVEDSPRTLPQFLFVVLLAVYLLRRRRFLKSVRREQTYLFPTGTEILVSDAYNVILIWFLCMVTIGAGIKSAGEIFEWLGPKLGQLLLSAIFSSVIALALIAKASQKFSPEGFLSNLRLRRGNRSPVEVVLVPALMGIFFAGVSSTIMLLRHTQPVTPLSEIIEGTESTFLFAVFLLMAILVAPLIEEIIFRGYFFYVISRVKGERFAVYMISLIFALLHAGQYWGDWAAIGMVLVLGFALTLLRARTGTTLASITAHYAYNAGVTIIPFYFL